MLVKQQRSNNIMPKPRYDEDKNETRHAAVDEDRCDEMSDKYGWPLKVTEATSGDLPIDCVFDGNCEFPLSRMELSQGDSDA